MTCPAASSGCNGPNEGECMGLCMHRMPIQFAPGYENGAPAQPSRIRYAVNTFRLYRKWGCGIRQSLKRAIHEFKQFHKPDPFKEQV